MGVNNQPPIQRVTISREMAQGLKLPTAATTFPEILESAGRDPLGRLASGGNNPNALEPGVDTFTTTNGFFASLLNPPGPDASNDPHTYYILLNYPEGTPTDNPSGVRSDTYKVVDNGDGMLGKDDVITVVNGQFEPLTSDTAAEGQDAALTALASLVAASELATPDSAPSDNGRSIAPQTYGPRRNQYQNEDTYNENIYEDRREVQF